MYNVRVDFCFITNLKYVRNVFFTVTRFVALMICENYRSNKTVTDCMCSITHAEREEHRITGHVLGANSYWIPSSLIKYHTNSINLLITKSYFHNTIIPASNQLKAIIRKWKALMHENIKKALLYEFLLKIMI